MSGIRARCSDSRTIIRPNGIRADPAIGPDPSRVAFVSGQITVEPANDNASARRFEQKLQRPPTKWGAECGRHHADSIPVSGHEGTMDW